MAHGKSIGHLIDDAKVVTPMYLIPIISKKAGDTDCNTMEHLVSGTWGYQIVTLLATSGEPERSSHDPDMQISQKQLEIALDRQLVL